jgi:hypothetical protein
MVLIVVMIAYLISPVFYSYRDQSEQEYTNTSYSFTVTPPELASKFHFHIPVNTLFILLLLSLLGNSFFSFLHDQSDKEAGRSWSHLLPSINAP